VAQGRAAASARAKPPHIRVGGATITPTQAVNEVAWVALSLLYGLAAGVLCAEAAWCAGCT
jgi:hypothetical protein